MQPHQYRQIHTNLVTAAIVSHAVSGDPELYTFIGKPSDLEMRVLVFERSPDWWVSPDNVRIEDFQVIEFLREEY